MTCPTERELSGFQARTLGADEARRIEEHLAGCAACAHFLLGRGGAAVSITAIAPTLVARRRGPLGRPVSLEPEAAPAAEGPLPRGTGVGRYVLLDRLGAGGMGEVYTAFDPQLDRKVALKLLKMGILDAEEGRSRLMREAQAMARLAHPNVIGVHDVGTFEDRVFIAMEFVDGPTLSVWAEVPRPWEEVLQVFIHSGRGLAAAHAAGLVHRDFKPDNVLLGKDGRARVLDFGLARQASARDGAEPGAVLKALQTQSPSGILHTPLTQAGTILGTPAYMSPEQLDGHSTDARTDQFSFCVALYEALYGTRPFTSDSYAQLIMAMHLGKVAEPPRDTKVPAWVYRTLVKGLSADPERRFPTMDALLGELSRDPRAQRKRRLAVGSVVLVLGFVAAGAAITSHRRAAVCQGAELKLNGIWDAARKQTIGAAFDHTHKSFAQDSYLRARDMLDEYTRSWTAMETDACEANRVRRDQTNEVFALRTLCLENRLGEVKALTDLFMDADPDVVSNAVHAVHSLHGLGECADARGLVARAQPEDPALKAKLDVLRSRLIAAKALLDAGKYRKGVDAAEPLVAEAAPLHQRSFEAEAYFLLGRLQDRAGATKAAEQSLYEAAWAAEASRRDDLLVRIWSRLVQVVGYGEAHSSQAHELSRFATAAMERLGSDQEIEGELENSLGSLSLREAKYEESVAHFQRALNLRQKALGPDHPDVAVVLNNRGAALGKLGRYTEAAADYHRALAIEEKAFGPEHPNVASPLNNLGAIDARLGYRQEALEHLTRALTIREKAFGPNHPEVAASLIALAVGYDKAGDFEKAQAQHRRLLEIREAALGADNPLVAESLNNIGSSLSAQGRYSQALDYFQRARRILEHVEGPAHPNVAATLDNLGTAHRGLAQLDLAMSDYERARSIWEKALGPDHPNLARVHHNLGELWNAKQRPELALAEYERALVIREKTLGKNHESLAYDLIGIGRSWVQLKAPAKAVPILERAIHLRESDRSGPGELAEAKFALASALVDVDRPRARNLVAEALGAYAQGGERFKAEIASLGRWQDQHP